MSTRRTNPTQLWNAIRRAGGMDAYVDEQLKENGFLVERRETDGMSRRELTAYKKELKKEAEEKRRLKKEAWQAYKSQHMVHLGEGVYFNDADNLDKWDLEKAEERTAENELPPLDTPKQLAEALGLSISELRWLSYHRDAATTTHYKQFFICKKNGSQRPIWAPMPKLKAAQRWILENITEKLPVHGSSHGFLPGRSILTNASVHRNAAVVIRMDLENFFPTVTFPRVKGVFRKAGYREQVATILALLCTEAPREIVQHKGKTWYVSLGPRCLPQGAPTSPSITNTLCLRLDRRIAGLSQNRGWRYSRYADDLTFSYPIDAKKEPGISHLIRTITTIVVEEGFKIHKQKTHIARQGSRQKVTGLIVNQNLPPRVPRNRKRQIRAALHNLKQGKPLQPGDTLASLAGSIAYVYMSDPEWGRKSLKTLTTIKKKHEKQKHS